MLEFTELPFNLSGRIYRSVMPFGIHDTDGEMLSAYLGARISTVVVLAEDEEMSRIAGRNLVSLYQKQGWHVLHLPIKDYGVPDREMLQRSVVHVLNAARDGVNIAIHCSGGVGRTGMFAACIAKQLFNLTGEEAIAWVRNYIPRAVETEQQRLIVNEY